MTKARFVEGQFDLAKMPQSFALSGMFVPSRRRTPDADTDTRVVRTRVVRYESDSVSLTVTAPADLNVSDQGVLLAILRLAEPVKTVTTLPKHAGAIATTLTVVCRLRDIARVLGLDPGGNTLQLVKQSLERLVRTSVEVKVGEHWAIGAVVSKAAGDPKETLEITLHPFAAQVVMGAEGFRAHARIDLAHWRVLKNQTARALLVCLCGRLWPRGKRPVQDHFDIDDLVAGIWKAETAPASPDVIRWRRSAVRKALLDLAAIPGWSVWPKPIPGVVGVWVRRSIPT